MGADADEERIGSLTRIVEACDRVLGTLPVEYSERHPLRRDVEALRERIESELTRLETESR